MRPTLPAKEIIYLAIILLSMIALALIAISPPTFMDINNVYKGF
jgi:hypothetical protein